MGLYRGSKFKILPGLRVGLKTIKEATLQRVADSQHYLVAQ